MYEPPAVACHRLSRLSAGTGSAGGRGENRDHIPTSGHGTPRRTTEDLRSALQRAIDGVAAGQCDAIAIGYGLCNRGIVGLEARAVPVVIPRAHDCIGMLLGSSRCYLAQLEAQPGTYFQSAGWLENSPAGGRSASRILPSARTPMSPANSWWKNTARKTPIICSNNSTTSPGTISGWPTSLRRCPGRQNGRSGGNGRERGWKFERLPGDLGWLRRLLNADWNEREFLKLKPGERVGLEPTHCSSARNRHDNLAYPELSPAGLKLEVASGTGLQDVLFAQGVEFPCGGGGRCKGCRVKILKGVLPVSEEEKNADARGTCRGLASGVPAFHCRRSRLSLPMGNAHPERSFHFQVHTA